jgi:thioredoxin 1
MTEVILTDKNFKEEVLKSNLPVLVDFWATWCGPCQMIAPVVAEIAKEFEGKIKVAKLNIDENRQTTGIYKIMSIPALLIFKDGKVMDEIIGAIPKNKIIEHIKKFI